MEKDYIAGFRPIEEDVLTCMNCDRELITLTLVSREFPYNWVFQAACPCGDSSEPVEKQGKYLYNSVEPLRIVDAPVNKVGDVFEVRIITK